MSVSSARPPLLALAFALCASAACGNSTTPQPHGSPVLLRVYWVAGGAPQLVWSRVPDDVQPAVSPLATEVDFVFDRRLDGDRIEDTVNDGGVVTTHPKAMPPITVSWPDMATAPGAPPPRLSVAYNSSARFGGESSYVFARPVPAGFPSSDKITFELDLTNLTNSYGEPTEPPAKPITVNTTAFSVAIAAPTRLVTTSHQLPLVFSNRLSGVAAASAFVHVTAGGSAVSSKLLADASDPSRVYVAPADCLGRWPERTLFTVTVDEALTDAFGRALAKGVTAKFETGAANAFVPDASCPVADGGADGGGDASEAGGAEDGGADAPADGGAEASEGGAEVADGGAEVADGGAPAPEAGDAAVESAAD